MPPITPKTSATATVEALHAVPDTFPRFVEEICHEMGALYGPAAAQRYRDTGTALLRANLSQPEVQVLGVRHGGDIVGLALTALRDDVGLIPFVHVLSGFGGGAAEAALLTHAISTLRAGGVAGIVSEYVPLCPLEDATVFHNLGFEAIPRLLMFKRDLPPGEPALDSWPLLSPDYLQAAKLLLAAYKDHPGNQLHTEVRTQAKAVAFWNSVASGSFGRCREGYCRISMDGKMPSGVIAGCEVAPDTGFILQVAVRPALRGQGRGARLVKETLGAFSDAGLRQAALGVTANNPARRLYERLGFSVAREVVSHVWWRPGRTAR